MEERRQEEHELMEQEALEWNEALREGTGWEQEKREDSSFGGKNGQGKLYLCSTPIGNLDDITLRVLDTLKRVDLIAAEDTRHSIKLLNHFHIKTPMTSYHEYNKVEKARYLVEQLKKGVNIALVTDAGTPGISDPGEELVRQCHEAGVELTSFRDLRPALRLSLFQACLPGASVSRRFCRRIRRKADDSGRAETRDRTILVYEAPHRLERTLAELFKTLGERNITVCRELTKRYEEAFRTTFSGALSFYEDHEPKGECVIVIEGKSLTRWRGRDSRALRR